MSRGPKKCRVSWCWQDRDRYSTRGYCTECDEKAEEKKRLEYEASPKFRALEALENCKTGADLKEFIRIYIIEELL